MIQKIEEENKYYFPAMEKRNCVNCGLKTSTTEKKTQKHNEKG